jgi:Raf kinase inhibitor-like YbhB/YbcL family protein
MQRLTLAILAAAALAACNTGQAKTLALGRVQAKSAQPMSVTSDAFRRGGAIDRRNTAYGANVSPPLHWSAVPGARVYAVVLEDPDAPKPTPFVHWLIWNIQATSLPEGVPAQTAPAAIQGANEAGGIGFSGPHPPPLTGVHHYHFEVFALDAPLGLGGGGDLAALVKAMQGHVLADGELIGTFKAP